LAVAPVVGLFGRARWLKDKKQKTSQRCPSFARPLPLLI
jgi:hypothetical protein